MFKVVSRSSTHELEKEIKKFAQEYGQTLAEIYKRAHVLYMENEKRKRRVK